MGIVDVLFINVSEETLLLILTLLFLGKMEYLDFTIKENYIKILAAVVLTTIFSVLLHNYTGKNGFMIVVRILSFVFIYVLVYRENFFKIFKSFIIALFVFILGEFFGTLIMEGTTGISQQMLDNEYAGSVTYILLIIPRRILQILAVTVLYKKASDNGLHNNSI